MCLLSWKLVWKASACIYKEIAGSNWPKILSDSCSFEDESYPFYDPADIGRQFVCKNCFGIMKKEMRMPPSSIMNGLTVEKMPPDLTD